jgi:hypothetical protein
MVQTSRNNYTCLWDNDPNRINTFFNQNLKAQYPASYSILAEPIIRDDSIVWKPHFDNYIPASQLSEQQWGTLKNILGSRIDELSALLRKDNYSEQFVEQVFSFPGNKLDNKGKGDLEVLDRKHIMVECTGNGEIKDLCMANWCMKFADPQAIPVQIKGKDRLVAIDGALSFEFANSAPVKQTSIDFQLQAYRNGTYPEEIISKSTNSNGELILCDIKIPQQIQYAVTLSSGRLDGSFECDTSLQESKKRIVLPILENVEIKVVDGNGRGLPGEELKLSIGSSSEIYTSDEQGKIILSDVACPSELLASYNGSLQLEKRFKVAEDSSSFSFIIEQKNIAHFTLLDKEREPLKNMEVEYKLHGRSQRISTDESGQFTIDSLKQNDQISFSLSSLKGRPKKKLKIKDPNGSYTLIIRPDRWWIFVVLGILLLLFLLFWYNYQIIGFASGELEDYYLSYAEGEFNRDNQEKKAIILGYSLFRKTKAPFGSTVSVSHAGDCFKANASWENRWYYLFKRIPVTEDKTVYFVDEVSQELISTADMDIESNSAFRQHVDKIEFEYLGCNDLFDLRVTHPDYKEKKLTGQRLSELSRKDEQFAIYMEEKPRSFGSETVAQQGVSSTREYAKAGCSRIRVYYGFDNIPDEINIYCGPKLEIDSKRPMKTFSGITATCSGEEFEYFDLEVSGCPSEVLTVQLNENAFETSCWIYRIECIEY